MSFKCAVSIVLLSVFGLFAIHGQTNGEADPPADGLTLADLFGDHMVLQRNSEVPIWGWGVPGSTITVKVGTLAPQKTKVTPKSTWKCTVRTGTSAAPIEVTVSDGDKTITLSDVLLGEVWLASGQSNMEWTVSVSQDPAKEIAEANYPEIRLFHVAKQFAREPRVTLKEKAHWEVCSPDTISTFSAVAYFFGREIHKKLNVPVGLIESAWGGTAAESWTSLQELEKMPELAESLKKFKESPPDSEQIANYEKALEQWHEELKGKDAGLAGGKPVWADRDTTTGDWKKMEVPGFWEKSGLAGFDGAVWFRRELELPASWAGKPLELNLGKIDDSDITYFKSRPTW
jgi:sialate O-acetylesterase